MRHIILILAVALLAVLFGCKKDKDIQTPQTNEVENVEKEAQGSLKSSYLITVPWLPQVLPGDWNNTKNCGQTCCVMLGGFYNGSPINQYQITAQNEWLYSATGIAAFATPNGYYTDQNDLKDLLFFKHGLNADIKWGSNIYNILNFVICGTPCLAYVRTYLSTTGDEHWVIVVGRDGTNVIINDPGRSSSSDGQYKSYPITQFVASWMSTSRSGLYMPVY